MKAPTHTHESAPDAAVTVNHRELLALRTPARTINNQPNRKARAALAGSTRSGFRGRGMDFEEVRVYQPGDDPRIIDWRVTARRGHPYSKVFNEERERPVLFLVDQGASMHFGTRSCFKSVAAARAAALLAWSSHEAGERVGGLVWNGTASVRIAATRGRRGVLNLLQTIASPGDSEFPQETPFTEMLGRLDRMTPSGASVVVISDFYGMTDAACRRLERIASRCELSCVLTYDPLEQEAPPAGWYRISDGSNSTPIWTGDDSWRSEYGEAMRQRLDFLNKLARTRGATVIDLATNENVVSKLQRTFGQRTPSRQGGRS
ncbi:MAG: DUF58 domain-containing protein [Planctomycetota bacterium]|nr:DUF58 domain-containing protein [Planctomycetota bacterium]